MKSNFFQFNHIAILFALTIFTLWGCKEEPLTPNEDAGKVQTEHFTGGDDFGGGAGGNGNNDGNNGGGNNNGGNNGSGNSENAHFTAVIDGSNKSFPTQSYTETSMGVIVTGMNNSTQESIGLIITKTVAEGDTIELSGFQNTASYSASISNIYSATDGVVIFDKVTSTYVEGVFYFTAEDASNNKNVNIEDGSFYINR